jgi:hypothetical protein
MRGEGATEFQKMMCEMWFWRGKWKEMERREGEGYRGRRADGKQKHSAGLTAMTERTLGAKAGHLELLKGGKKNKDLKGKEIKSKEGEVKKGGSKKFG